MNLIISGHHLEITPALKEYVSSKICRALRHVEDLIIDANVLLSSDNLREKDRRQKISLTLHAIGRDIYLKAAHGDLYAAIDRLADKIEKPLNRIKKSRRSFSRDSIKNHIDQSAYN